MVIVCGGNGEGEAVEVERDVGADGNCQVISGGRDVSPEADDLGVAT
jgi:hypothetical protein